MPFLYGCRMMILTSPWMPMRILGSRGAALLGRHQMRRTCMCVRAQIPPRRSRALRQGSAISLPNRQVSTDCCHWFIGSTCNAWSNHTSLTPEHRHAHATAVLIIREFGLCTESAAQLKLCCTRMCCIGGAQGLYLMFAR